MLWHVGSINFTIGAFANQLLRLKVLPTLEALFISNAFSVLNCFRDLRTEVGWLLIYEGASETLFLERLNFKNLLFLVGLGCQTS